MCKKTGKGWGWGLYYPVMLGIIVSHYKDHVINQPVYSILVSSIFIFTPNVWGNDF